jgi:hypothetical protein
VDERGEIRQEGLELFFVLAPGMRRTLERTRDKRSSFIIFTRLNILVLASFVILFSIISALSSLLILVNDGGG